MAFDREAAKAAGYSDQEIDAFLANQSQAQPAQPSGSEPPPPQTQVPEINSTNAALGTAGVATAAAAPAAVAGYGVKKGLEMLRPVIPQGAPAQGPVAPTPTAQSGSLAARSAARNAPSAAARGGDALVRNLAIRGLQGGAPAIASAIAPAAVATGIAAVPGAMMYGDYKNWQQQTPDQQRQSAMDALSGQAPGQAGF